MSIFTEFRNFIKSNDKLYRLYTRIRYGARTKIRDWVLDSQRFINQNHLNSFIFEKNETYVRIDSGHEFKYVPEQMGGLLGLEFREGFEIDDIRAVIKLLPPEPVVLDIGANFGIYSILIASSSEKSQVHSFEPIERTASLLRDNAKRNCVDTRVIVNNLAVGSKPGRMIITADRYAGNYLITGKKYHGDVQEVSVIRIDDYVYEKGIKHLDLIKCDVEGAELLVMRGAEKVLAHMRPIVMLEIADVWTERFGYTPDDLKYFMSNAGYEIKHGSEVASTLGLKSVTSTQTHNYFFFPITQ
jgi:FkbM family methyltransferase